MSPGPPVVGWSSGRYSGAVRRAGGGLCRSWRGWMMTDRYRPGRRAALSDLADPDARAILEAVEAPRCDVVVPSGRCSRMAGHAGDHRVDTDRASDASRAGI